MVTGAVAAIIYGEPRLTNDIDLVVELRTEEIGKVQQAFSPEEFYCPPAENIKLEANRISRGHFNVIHHETGFKADFYLVGQDELHRWGMRNRKEFKIGGESFWLAPPEYVILRKLEYYREGGSEKHLRDIASMLTLSSDRIDFDLLQRKIESLGLQRVWAAAKKVMDESP
jgi:hypothetical protein